MAITNTPSDLMANIVASPPRLNPNNRSKGKLVLERFTCTQGAAAGDVNSTFRLCKLPQRARYISHLSKVRYSAHGAARLVSIGWEAYTDPNTGAPVAASMTGLGSGLDVSAAGMAVLDALTNAVDEREFAGEAVLVAQVTGGTIPAAATFNGIIAYLLP